MFELQQEKNQSNRKYLIVFEPRQSFGAQNEPIVPWTAFHDAQIGDGHVPFADDLIAELSSCIAGILRRLLGAIKFGERKKNKCIRKTLKNNWANCLQLIECKQVAEGGDTKVSIMKMILELAKITDVTLRNQHF